jgi:hypothetical protein
MVNDNSLEQHVLHVMATSTISTGNSIIMMRVHEKFPKATREEVYAVITNQNAELDQATEYQCATCDETKRDTPNVANHFNIKGEPCQWMMCNECKEAFEEDDITFEFSANKQK